MNAIFEVIVGYAIGAVALAASMYIWKTTVEIMKAIFGWEAETGQRR